MSDLASITGDQAAAGRIPDVHELTQKIKHLLESGFSDVSVQGEVSGARPSANGHLYFTLKDEKAQLSCVIWRSTFARLKEQGIEIRDGSSLVLEGGIQLYAPRGTYQLVVESVRTSGSGALFEAFERLKRKLLEEGLFDAGRKRPIPAYPMTIGVVTSANGAAFRDIASTLERRWPVATIVLCHAAVQGASAPDELIAGLRTLDARRDVEVIIIGRGGGSIEDLWAFNDERLARAIAASATPVISAVGHEIDTSISDFVADLSAATPTQAAVKATPDIRDLRMRVSDLGDMLSHRTLEGLASRRRQVRTLAESYAIRVLHDRIRTSHERWLRLSGRLDRHAGRLRDSASMVAATRLRLTDLAQRRLERSRHAVSHLQLRLDTLDPETPLRRGYSRVMQNGEWVRSRMSYDPASGATLVWRDGQAGTGPAADAPAAARGPNQGAMKHARPSPPDAP
jgi:exodeoxyribonuclease VII large subunit